MGHDDQLGLNNILYIVEAIVLAILIVWRSRIRRRRDQAVDDSNEPSPDFEFIELPPEAFRQEGDDSAPLTEETAQDESTLAVAEDANEDRS
jgi:FtsZ-interacting cell division protein ZipA